jgi:hypothetical protein
MAGSEVSQQQSVWVCNIVLPNMVPVLEVFQPKFCMDFYFSYTCYVHHPSLYPKLNSPINLQFPGIRNLNPCTMGLPGFLLRGLQIVVCYYDAQPARWHTSAAGLIRG